MNIAYFDCFSGISGDMVLGALLDLGLKRKTLEEGLKGLRLRNFELQIKKVKRSGIKGTGIKVKGATNKPTSFDDIKRLIEDSRLSEEVKDISVKIFHNLARAEAKVHGTTPEKIHFHEVGATDSIVDIVGCAIGINAMGIGEVISSPLPLGSGSIKCRHGEYPLPSPATVEILKGLPVYSGNHNREMVTPTGAAIVSSLAKSFEGIPPMVISRVGYGAGSRTNGPLPNFLRVIMGTKGEGRYERDRIFVVETNIDDMNPELYGSLLQRLFDEGALDVTLTPTIMKKGRPGLILKVLAAELKRGRLVDLIFNETTTIGLRYYPASRVMLHKEEKEVMTSFGPLRVKVSRIGEKVYNIMPEISDCERLAAKNNIPVKVIYEEAKGKLKNGEMVNG